MRRALPIVAALVLALAGCGQQATEKPAEEPAAQEVSEETTEVVEEQVAEEPEIEWTEVASADEAAKGAGFEKFGVIDSFKIGDLEFKDPKFAYAGGVAQATYETPATMIYVRKGEGSYSTPLSDRNLDEFASRWFKVIEGTNITCYGVAKGAVTVATWSDGNTSYGLTFQGLGGDEMSMDADELAVLVRGINEHNGDTDATEKKEEAEEQQKQQAKDTLISAAEADALVEKDCGGTCTAIDRVSTKQYGDCWYATARDAKGNTYAYYVDNNGVHLIEKKEAAQQQTPKADTKPGEHYEGEPVTIYSNIYAEWHQVDETWVATFITYNGTQIFAQTAPAGGGWVFYALKNGQQVQVIYSDQESTAEGKLGPAGVSSHWVELDGDTWY